MSKKLGGIIFSFVVIAITIVLLVIYFVNPKAEDSNLKPSNVLTANVDDISLSVGEEIYNYYEINDISAEVSFEVDKDGIIYIDKNMIKGLSAGEVTVILYAKVNNYSTQTTFKVRVFTDNYRLKLTGISSCTIEGNNIVATNNVIQISVEIYNKLNVKIDNASYSVTSNLPSTIIDKSMYNVIIIAEE